MQAPHEVRDKTKFESMVSTLENGGSLPPVIACGEIAFSGSHRIAAWKHCGIEPDAINIDDSEVADVMIAMGLDPEYDGISHFDDFCHTLYKITEWDDVREAVADQF